MRAYFGAGDDKAAERVDETYVSALEQMQLDEVKPELAEAYKQTRRGTAGRRNGADGRRPQRPRRSVNVPIPRGRAYRQAVAGWVQRRDRRLGGAGEATGVSRTRGSFLSLPRFGA